MSGEMHSFNSDITEVTCGSFILKNKYNSPKVAEMTHNESLISFAPVIKVLSRI